MTRIFLTTVGAGTWTVPADWNSANNSIECIGGGSPDLSYVGNAGGGGAYSKKNNLVLTPGASISYNVGHAQYLSEIGNTWFYSNTTVFAAGASLTTGGQASSGYGDVKHSGGSAPDITGAGAGAAGPNGDGNPPNGGTGGSGDAGYGGLGGDAYQNGGNGTEWDSTHGSGGGGGYDASGGKYGSGGGRYGWGTQGLIVITYTPAETNNAIFFGNNF